MKRSILSMIAGLITLSVSVTAVSPSIAQVDLGGRVSDYLAIVNQFNHDHAEMRISGYCASACTEKLGIRRVCVFPDTVLGFHQASYADGSFAMFGTIVLKVLIGHFPRLLDRVRPWLYTPVVQKMTGLEAHRLGVPLCSGPKP